MYKKKMIPSLLLVLFLLLFSNNLLADTCGGDIPCNCGDTLIADHVMWYNLNSTGTGPTIGADSIVLDCNGHYLRGSGRYTGVLLSDRNGVAVKNCDMQNFEMSIALKYNSDNNIIENNTLFRLPKSGSIWQKRLLSRSRFTTSWEKWSPRL